jgi:hypothetical protein
MKAGSQIGQMKVWISIVFIVQLGEVETVLIFLIQIVVTKKPFTPLSLSSHLSLDLLTSSTLSPL